MSFGSSNPPWQRNTLGNNGQPNPMANLQSQMTNTNFVGFQNLAMSNQTPQNNLLISQLGNNINTLNNTNALFANHQTLQYQNRTGLNPNAFGPVQTTQQILHHQTQSQSNQPPAQNNPNSGTSQICNNAAFKWNTNLVPQVTPPNQGHGMNVRPSANQSHVQHPIVQSPQHQSQQQQSQTARGFPGYNATQPQCNYTNSFDRASNSVRTTHSSRQSSPPPRRSSPERNSRRDEDDRKRRKEREREREKDQEKRDDRSPARRISPRRRTRPIPRYMVQVPKFTLNALEADILELRRRYTNLYVPSEFFYSRIRWPESFPCHAPFTIKRPSAFHIFHKSVENPNGIENEAEFDPPDVDDTFSAKVMLMSVPSMSEFYRKCFAGPDEKERDDLLHPSRLISFLVGVQGKNETMAIGGAWSPSLDGHNPEKDPSVLIKTAIRTCKALTGIDLSPCTQWYRFVELYYRRVESTRKGRTVPARTQTVVIYLPDVRSCLPTRLEWDELSIKYKKHLDKKRSNVIESDDQNCSSAKDEAHDIDVSEMADESKFEKQANNDGDKCHSVQVDSSDADAESSLANAASNSKDEKDAKPERIHSDLDLKTMKIQDLREQLDARSLSSKGLKPQLVARLSKALKSEENVLIAIDVECNAVEVQGESSNEIHECDSNDSLDIDMNDIVVIDEYDSKTDAKNESSSRKSSSKKIDEREHRWLENWVIDCLNNHKFFVIQLNTIRWISLHAKCDRFQFCWIIGPMIRKKPCFEVSFFAELFNEMLMRDFGFNIYKVLYSMPESELSGDPDSKERRDKSIDNEPKEKRRKETDTIDSKSSRKDDASTSHDKSKAEDKDSKLGKDSRQKDKEKEKSYRERRISRRDDESDEESSVDDKRRETKKLNVVDPDLLFSFIYFDQTYCGYIFSNHLEELFYSLGLRLSRSDTKKIINKVAPRSLFYRKLTDKPKDELPTVLTDSIENEEELGKGNTALLPFADSAVSQINAIHTESNEETVNDESTLDKLNDDSSADCHMVMHKGALIDVGKLLQQLSRSEKAREETEVRLTELTKSNADLQSGQTRAKDRIKDLQSELKSCSRKMNEAESSLSNSNKKCAEYYSILNGIHDRVSTVFIKSERSSSKKDSSARDKDRRERDKDKNGAQTVKDKEKDIKDKVSDTKSELKQEKAEKQDEN